MREYWQYFIGQWSARVSRGVDGRRKVGWVGRPARTVIIMAAHCAFSYMLENLGQRLEAGPGYLEQQQQSWSAQLESA